MAAISTSTAKPWLTAGLAVSLALVFGLTHHWPERITALALSEAAPSQVWRWLTSHWLHVDTAHLLWNVVALLVLGALIEPYSRRLFIGLLLCGVAGVTGTFFALAETPVYVGFSGVLNALFAGALYVVWQDTRSAWLKAGVVVAAIIGLARLLAGSMADHVPLADQWTVASWSHWAGSLSGLGFIAALGLWPRTTCSACGQSQT